MSNETIKLFFLFVDNLTSTLLVSAVVVVVVVVAF